MPSAASRVRCLPTGMDPVKVTLRTMGDGMRCSETSEGTPNTRFSTPRGRPASCRARVIATAVPGVSSDGLRMHEQPAPSAPAILRAGVTAGKFHGVNAATGPHRLADDHLAGAGQPARNQPAVGAAAFLGVPLEDVRRDLDLEDRLAQRLAFFHGQGAADGVGAFPDQLAGLPQHPAALVGGGVAPYLESRRRGFERPVQIAFRGMRKKCQRFFRRRVDDVLAGAVTALPEFAVDVQGEFFVHVYSLLS